MNDLHEVTKEPVFLTKRGFQRRDEDSTDYVRWVWFEKVFESINSQIRFVVQIEFELSISDDPFSSYTDNHHYSFNGIYLQVIDRQMERWDSEMYDEETEHPRDIDRWELQIHTMSRLKSFCMMLGDRSW